MLISLIKVLRLFKDLLTSASCLLELIFGKAIAAKIPKITITKTSSNMVKAFFIYILEKFLFLGLKISSSTLTNSFFS